MQIVESSATLLSHTPDAEQLIERCGRVCYKSEDKIRGSDADVPSANAFIRMLIDRGHHSVLEHASATVLFVCDRGVSHELVRHRLASFSQESTRYCNYGSGRFGGEISIIRPVDTPHPNIQSVLYAKWNCLYLAAEKAYLSLIAAGVSPQLARSVLPICLKTEIVVTANFREWRHIFKLRLAADAHPAMRHVMHLAWKELVVVAPNVFKDI